MVCMRYRSLLGDREPDETLRLPGVLPLVDLNAGVRFIIAEKATVRLEGGLHTMLYAGMSTGILF